MLCENALFPKKLPKISLHLAKDQTNLVYQIKILRPRPGANVPVLRRGHIGYTVNMHYYFQNLHYLWAKIRQTMSMLIIRNARKGFLNCKLRELRVIICVFIKEILRPE